MPTSTQTAPATDDAARRIELLERIVIEQQQRIRQLEQEIRGMRNI